MFCSWLQVELKPRAQGAHAKDRDFTRNAFNWDGSYYYVYAKLANCASSTGTGSTLTSLYQHRLSLSGVNCAIQLLVSRIY